MIVPTADRTKATVLTKVKFLEFDDRILPEMSAKVAFLSRPMAARRAPAPPHPAPRPPWLPGMASTFAYLLKDSEVRLVQVALGETMGDLVEIKGGLQEGDRVVLKPAAGLSDGARVKVKE